MKVLSNQLLPGLHGRPILTDVLYNETGTPKPVIIFVHGFKGFKDWGYFNLMAREFVNTGFVFVKFNFAFNGTTIDHPTEFADLEAFGNNNLSKELDDLGVVIDYLWNDPALQKETDRNRLFLIGHSRGGGITILKTAEDERIKGIVTLASVGEFGAYWSEEEVKEWKETGAVWFDNVRTHQRMPIYYQYYEDFVAHKDRLNVRNAVEQMNIPFLAIHGTDDAVVPFSMAERFLQWNPSVHVLAIEKGDHTFGGRHPYDGQELPGDAKTVVEEAKRFLSEI